MDVPKILDLILFDLLIVYDLLNIISATKSCFSTPINSYLIASATKSIS